MTDPRTVFTELITGIGEGKWADLSRLYAEDAVAAQPLGLPEPGRIVGRADIHAHFTAAGRLPFRLVARNIVVHSTTDPEVVIAEYDYDAADAATGRAVTFANVQVLRVRNGRIVETRDYHDHHRLASLAQPG